MSELNFNEVQGVIFDMDGVLCDSEPYMIRAAQSLYLDWYHRQIDDAAFEPYYGRGDTEFICGPPEDVGLNVDRDQLMAAFFTAYFELITGQMKPLPGVSTLVDQLARSGKQLAVATSSDPRKLEGNLLEIGISPDTFGALVSAADVERKKPAPDLFLTAAQRLGLSPAHCLVIEDTPSGVKAAGCLCLAVITNFDEQTLRTAGADQIVSDLTIVRVG